MALLLALLLATSGLLPLAILAPLLLYFIALVRRQFLYRLILFTNHFPLFRSKGIPVPHLQLRAMLLLRRHAWIAFGNTQPFFSFCRDPCCSTPAQAEPGLPFAEASIAPRTVARIQPKRTRKARSIARTRPCYPYEPFSHSSNSSSR